MSFQQSATNDYNCIKGTLESSFPESLDTRRLATRAAAALARTTGRFDPLAGVAAMAHSIDRIA